MNLSKQLYARSLDLIPGGVNSPVRAFHGVGGEPIYFKSGKGAYLTDVDDKQYIDYVGSWGPLILGHCHPAVVDSIIQIVHSGTSFGAPTELEIQLAERIISLMPSIEKIRMVNSGTEATMTAIRLARGFTNRSKIIKFNGCYHGHTDALLVRSSSNSDSTSKPMSLGIPLEVTANTLTADYNNLDQTRDLFLEHTDDIAAVIVEPIAGNMGFVMPKSGFLQGLRELCDQYGALLILDEVMTGFRAALGGAQSIFGIQPDLTTLGKVIGGGLPVGALGGKSVIMDCLAPIGKVFQAGTLSGNPLAMAAGLATLNEIAKPGVFQRVSDITIQLLMSLTDTVQSFGIPFSAVSVGSMFGFYFSDNPDIENLDDVTSADETRFIRFFHGMLQKGVYFAPSRFEAGFVSTQHGVAEIEATTAAARHVLQSI